MWQIKGILLIIQTLRLVRGRSQTTFTDFWPFLAPLPPWLTALLNEICQIFMNPPPAIAVNVICE